MVLVFAYAPIAARLLARRRSRARLRTDNCLILVTLIYLLFRNAAMVVVTNYRSSWTVSSRILRLVRSLFDLVKVLFFK